jgi:thymidylate kinase
LSLIKLFYLLFTAWPAWVRNVSPALRRREWVILDRGPTDLICDPRRYRYGGPLWIAHVWVKFMPQPDKIIVLTAAPHNIAKRKLEVSKEELERQVVQYQNLSGKKFIHVCSSDTPEETLKKTLDKLFGLKNRL